MNLLISREVGRSQFDNYIKLNLIKSKKFISSFLRFKLPYQLDIY
jgi:hypothetical protein